MSRLVVIESPYAGEVELNVAYAKRCVRDCLRRGETPYASHLFFPPILNDLVPEERALGIWSGYEWRSRADAVIFYCDRGISYGMQTAWATLGDLKGVLRCLDRKVTLEDWKQFQ